MSGEVVSAAESEISDIEEPENAASEVSEVSGISEAQGQPSPIEQTEQSAIYLPAETDEVAVRPTQEPLPKNIPTRFLSNSSWGRCFLPAVRRVTAPNRPRSTM